MLVGKRWNIGIVDLRTSPHFCLFATPATAAFWRSFKGLFQIDSALTPICFPSRDDPDNFFTIWVVFTYK